MDRFAAMAHFPHRDFRPAWSAWWHDALFAPPGLGEGRSASIRPWMYRFLRLPLPKPPR
jgi:hypothetical protein